MDCTTCDGSGSIFFEMDDEGRCVYLSCPDCGSTVSASADTKTPDETALDDVPF